MSDDAKWLRARKLTRQGYLVEEQGVTYMADIDTDNALTPLQAASCTYRHRVRAARWTEGAEPANSPHTPPRLGGERDAPFSLWEKGWG